MFNHMSCTSTAIRFMFTFVAVQTWEYLKYLILRLAMIWSTEQYLMGRTSADLRWFNPMWESLINRAIRSTSSYIHIPTNYHLLILESTDPIIRLRPAKSAIDINEEGANIQCAFCSLHRQTSSQFSYLAYIARSLHSLLWFFGVDRFTRLLRICQFLVLSRYALQSEHHEWYNYQLRHFVLHFLNPNPWVNGTVGSAHARLCMLRKYTVSMYPPSSLN